MRLPSVALQVAVFVSAFGVAPCMAQSASQTKRRLEALVSHLDKATSGQQTRLWGRNKIERFVVNRYSALGKATVEGTGFEIKIGDMTYTVQTSGETVQTVEGVSILIKGKKVNEAIVFDKGGDGTVDRGEFYKRKAPAERRLLTDTEGTEHREFWQSEFEKALDALCQFLDVKVD